MKQITKTQIFLTSLSFFALTVSAQNLNHFSDGTKNSGKNIKNVPAQKRAILSEVAPTEILPQNMPSGNKAASLSCTDKVNYVGTPSQYYIQVGGNYAPSFDKTTGVFQVYPSYKGVVTGVEFNAAKFTSNPTVYVAIFDVDMWGEPITTTQSPPETVVVTSVANTLYNVTFATPFQVTGNYGFAVGFYTLGNQDSVKAFSGPQLTSWSTNYGFISFAPNNFIYSFPNYLGSSYDLNVLLRPIITTSISASMISSKKSVGCALPAVHGFTNTSSLTNPAWINNPIINPGGITSTLDYGDGTPVLNNLSGPVQHSYTAIGTYTAEYIRTYDGWTNNCAESSTVQVDVDSPIPAFTYNTNGLTVMFTNTSLNMLSYTWNFGDLSTSTQTDPTHTFSSPGTYVVELEGQAPCGKVTFVQTIVVSAGTGIGENTGNSNSIALYPNPASNTLKISSKSKTEFGQKIEIFNSIGASVKTIQNTDINSDSTSVDVSDLSKGIYFLKLNTKEGDIIKSFVKE